MRTLLSLLLLSKAFQLFDCFFLSSFLPSLFLFFFFGGGGGEGHAWLPVLALNIQFSCLHLLRAGITVVHYHVQLCEEILEQLRALGFHHNHKDADRVGTNLAKSE
jgi:hypothetical protein